MDYRDNIAKAVDYIEDNLRYEVDLAACARACGYSQYHFLRVFRKTTGLTPVDYIRKRRLTEITKRICERGGNICDIAFEYGFNSKENFIRAFRTEHNILPTEFRAAENSLKLYEKLHFEPQELEVIPEIIDLTPFSLTVYKSTEASPPRFWNVYNAKKLSLRLSGGGVCEDFGVPVWNDEEMKLDYYIGIKTEDARGDTRDTQELRINGGKYAVFTTPRAAHAGFIDMIHRTWKYIYKVWLPKSGYRRACGHEFESYVEVSRTFSERIYIPITENRD